MSIDIKALRDWAKNPIPKSLCHINTGGIKEIYIAPDTHIEKFDVDRWRELDREMHKRYVLGDFERTEPKRQITIINNSNQPLIVNKNNNNMELNLCNGYGGSGRRRPFVIELRDSKDLDYLSAKGVIDEVHGDRNGTCGITLSKRAFDILGVDEIEVRRNCKVLNVYNRVSHYGRSYREQVKQLERDLAKAYETPSSYFGIDLGRNERTVNGFEFYIPKPQPEIEKKRTEKEALIEIDLLQHALEDATKEIETLTDGRALDKSYLDQHNNTIERLKKENKEEKERHLKSCDVLRNTEDRLEKALREVSRLKETVRNLSSNYSTTLNVINRQTQPNYYEIPF